MRGGDTFPEWLRNWNGAETLRRLGRENSGLPANRGQRSLHHLRIRRQEAVGHEVSSTQVIRSQARHVMQTLWRGG